jgi:hypothetical protein
MKNSSVEKIILDFIEKLHLNYFKSNNGLPSSDSYKVIRAFEKASQQRNRIKMILADGETCVCYPQAIEVRKGKINFVISKRNAFVRVNPDDVLDIEFLSKNKKFQYMSSQVVFEMYGKLARNYRLRENEQILRVKDDGTIIVQNLFEDKEKLLHRLLRYDSSCKVIHPTEFAEEMQNVIDDTLSNYNP